MNDMERHFYAFSEYTICNDISLILTIRQRAVTDPELCLLSLSLTRTAILKRHETCRNPKYSKAVRGRTEDLKRHEACRNPKYFKAVRGRTALQNF